MTVKKPFEDQRRYAREFLGLSCEHGLPPPPRSSPRDKPDEPRPVRRLQQLREELDWSQQLLGEVFGVSRQTINAIEKGRSMPSLRLAIALAQFLGTTVESLFDDYADDWWVERVKKVEQLRKDPSDPKLANSRQHQWGVSRIGEYGARCSPEEQIQRGLRDRTIVEDESPEEHAHRVFVRTLNRMQPFESDED